MDIYDEMRATAEELLRVTELTTLSGKEELLEREVSDYTFLLEKREPLLRKLRTLMELPEASDRERRRETNELLARVAETDRRHAEAANEIMSLVRQRIQGLQRTKKLNAGYANPAEYAGAGVGIDTSQ
jgi:dsDNA-binding SOS-regulon protein